jgi:hypothetical protein
VSRQSLVCLAGILVASACSGSPHQLIGPSLSDGVVPVPGISAVAASAVAPSAARISWTTDADSDSHVEYGPTESYGTVLSAPDLVKDHVVTIGGLTPGTSYHFRVRSGDGGGAQAISDNHTFTTPAEGASVVTPAAVRFSEPSANATVSGRVTVAAETVGDAAAVQFRLDGGDLGAEDARAPFSVRWDTTEVGDGSHRLTAVVRDASGASTSSASVTVHVRNAAESAPSPPSKPSPKTPDPPDAPSAPAPPPPGGSNADWPNEPGGFRTINDQSWGATTGNGWSYLRRQGSKNDDIVSDSSAPESAASVLRMIFTTDMDRDSEPGVHWLRLGSRPREIFTGWWMKLSPNWRPSPAGGGKITFLWAPDGQGQVYSNIGGSSAPHRININTEWAPYGQKFWEPNVATTRVNYGTWYRVEWYLRWESSPGRGDGIIRWWVNGVLNGDYRSVRFPGCCLQQFEFAPTLQNPPPTEQYMYIDHTYVSAP